MKKIQSHSSFSLSFIFAALISMNVSAQTKGTVTKSAAALVTRYDVYLRLDKVVAKKVVEGPLDNEEDLLGNQSFYSFIDKSPIPVGIVQHYQNFWYSTSGLLEVGTTERLMPTAEYKILQDLTFDQVKFGSFQVGGLVRDWEPVISMDYTCKECEIGKPFRSFSIADNANALTDLINLQVTTQPVALRFGNDRYFEVNYYEDINELTTSSHITFYWQMKILKHI